MNRIRHINTRNLVVTETFDEFAEKVEQLDSYVEDIVGFVTSITRVFYWLNVESVWGVLGFTWEPSSFEDLDPEQYPNVWERLEHIIAAGKNIDGEHGELTPEEQKQLEDALKRRNTPLKKGYGHFNATTLPFTIIPKLPDGYRISEFRSTFDLIESKYIEVQKSDWSNLVDINNLIPPGKSIKIDITDANLNSNTKNIINRGGDSNTQNNLWKYTIDIKGDLSNCINGVFEQTWNAFNHMTDVKGSWVSKHTVILRDDNKDLQLPLSLGITSQFYYIGNEVFDIREWLLDNVSESLNNKFITLWAKSRKYHINWAFASRFNNDNTTTCLQISPLSGLNVTPETFDGTLPIITDPITQEITPASVTIDCAGSDGNIREDLLFGIDNPVYAKTTIDGNYNIYPYNTQCYEPIVYNGTVNSITMWNPFVIVKDDNSWPAYSQSMINKLTKYTTYGINEGHFMYGSYIYITKPSPYTIDCTNLRYLNLFRYARFVVNDFSNFEILGNNTKVIELFKLINADNFISFDMNPQMNTEFFIKLPHIRTVLMGYRTSGSSRIRGYIPEGVTLEASTFPMAWGDNSFRIARTSVSAFKIRHVDAREYGSTYSAKFQYTYIAPIVSEQIENYITVEDGLLQDTDFLKASCINTGITIGSYNGERIINHPIIGTNKCVYSVDFVNVKYTINGDTFFYNIDISMTGYNNKPELLSHMVNQFINKIYPGLQENDTGTGLTITLSANIYDEIHNNYSAVFNDIENNLKYTWQRTNS